MHWDSGKLRQPVELCFQALAADVDPKFSDYATRSLAFDVVELLGWRTRDDFNSDPSDNDVAELQNLVTAVKTGEIKLYLTEQARDEFQRNRDSAIAESLKAIGNQRLAPSFPRMFVNHAGYEELDQSVKAYEEQRKKMLAEVTEAAASNELSADRLIKELLELAHVIPLTAEIWERAKRRYDLRNAPGKGQSYGDAVHWESLLSEVPDGENLLLVTDDADFKSKLDPARVADFLRDEWRRKKGSDVTVYANLSSMFRDHFRDTKLLVEAEQEMAARALAVESLTGSENFLQTHVAVQLASQHSDFTRNEVEELFRAAVQNTQIRWIIEDDDVFRFFTQLAHQYSDVIDPALLSEFWALFERDSAWDWRPFQGPLLRTGRGHIRGARDHTND